MPLPVAAAPQFQRWDRNGVAELEAGQRFTYDGRDTVGYPLVTIGDRVAANVEEEAGERRISFPAIGWEIVHPTAAEGERLPSSLAMDVFYGLMFLYGEQGFPDSGEIRFSRSDFLQLIGWVSQGKPSGRHYDQLVSALKYLSRTLFLNQSQAVQVGVMDGKAFKGVQGFPIAQYFQVNEDQPGPRPEGERLPQRSVVHLSKPFIRIIDGGRRAARMNYDLFLSLPPGTPRSLWRLFTWMVQEGKTELTLREVFARMGSTQTECVPARAKQILTRAHQELQRRGVIAEEPQYVKTAEGDWAVRYVFGNPEQLITEEELLVGQAIAYGVNATTARELAVAHRAQFEQVLAAVTLGSLRPTRTLAAMIVHFTKKGYDIASQVQRERVQLTMDLGSTELRYLAWATAERQQRLASRRDIQLETVRAQVAQEHERQQRGTAPWVLEGLVQVRLNQLLGVETLEQYRLMMAAQPVAASV